MTKDSNVFMTGAAVGALLAGSFGSIAGYKLGSIFGHQIYFVEKEENTSYITETQKESICDLAIAPLRKSMLKNCNLDNFEHGTVLKDISEKKDQVLEQYACTPQVWQCKPSKPSDLQNSEYKVEFRY